MSRAKGLFRPGVHGGTVDNRTNGDDYTGRGFAYVIFISTDDIGFVRNVHDFDRSRSKRRQFFRILSITNIIQYILTYFTGTKKHSET